MMLDILKRIQGDLAGLESDVSGLKTDVSGLTTDMADVKSRLERVETALRKQSRDSAALLVMMRGTVGVFNERVGNLKEGIRLIREHE
ncbi:MAG: hypothetical protein AB7F78_24490 [Hyphomicrobiaceae bacterium]